MFVQELEPDDIQFEILGKLNKDLRKAAENMGRDEARYLVEAYYQVQKMRIAVAGQLRSLVDEYCQGNKARKIKGHFTEEELEQIKADLTDAQFRKWKEERFKETGKGTFITWMRDTLKTLETSCGAALGRYAKQWAVGAWMQSITGIGPVISAGMLAHPDIRICKTFGQLWAYAGLDPTKTWEKGQKRPWNAELRTLCFKTGECFCKVQNNEKDYYGKIFAARKDKERRDNFAGKFQQQAKDILKAKNFSKTTDAYKWYSGRYKGHECMALLNSGEEFTANKLTLYKEGEGTPMLPPAHCHARARRKAVKMFLSHLHHMMHVDYYGELPLIPWVFAHGNEDGAHTHYLEPPNQDKAVGRPLRELLEG